VSYKIVDDIIQSGCFYASDKLVLLSIASHANDANREAWPSVETIMWQTGLSRRAVQRALRNLERLEIIIPTTTKLGGTRNSVHYFVADVNSPGVQKALLEKQRHRDAVNKSKGRHSDAVQQRLNETEPRLSDAPNSVIDSTKGRHSDARICNESVS
jgi:hypothetical protein